MGRWSGASGTTQPGLKKLQLFLFLLYLYLGGRNKLSDLQIIHDELVEAYMIDCLFQITTEETR